MGFISFALGVSLLASSLLPVGAKLISQSGRQQLQNALRPDFQETSTFRDYLSEVMNRFIAMGAGGPVSGSYYDYSGYDGDVWIQSEAVAGTVLIQSGIDWVSDTTPAQPSETVKDHWKRDAEAYHQSIQNDKNILYIVKNGDTVLYTNLDTDRYDHANRPDGHNFILSFYDGKCTVANDGVPLPIYGEGSSDLYADDGKHWALPGYTNFPAGASAKGVSVYIAVADTPALYRAPDYASGWSQWQYNHLYQLEQNWREARDLLAYGAVRAGIGLMLMILWFILRRNKALADRAIASVTGRIWFELKLLVLLSAAALLLLPLSGGMRELFEEVTYVISIEGGSYFRYPWILEQYLYQLAQRPAAVLCFFWAAYLCVNDLRYGDKPWRHGLLGMLTARSLKLPIQKRLSRRWGLLGLGIVLLGAELISLLILQTLRVALPRWAIWNLFLLPLLLVLAGYLWSLRGQRRLAVDLGLLADQITAVRDGDFAVSPLPADSDLGKVSQEVADIQQGIAQAVEKQTRSERMKVELITNVSHDLKTPLTSMISYTELLKQEQLPPPAGEYVEILSQKSERLRAMVLDVFEISKAASGDLPVKLETLDLAKLIRQTVADMSEEVQAAPMVLKQLLPEAPVLVTADGDRLYRVFQNLLQNALQYALEGSRVYLSLSVEGRRAVASVKNTSKTELPEGMDYVARFVRGDASRTDGGSGLGLAIADSFTRACGGEFRVEPVADLFVVTVSFPLAPDGEIQD